MHPLAFLHTKTFLGRPVKPLAFAVMMSVASVFWFNIVLESDVFAASFSSNFVGLAAGASTVMLFGGWWFRSQVLAEVGLLLATGVWVARTAALCLMYGPGDYGVWYSLCWVLAAGSSYLLEAWYSDDGICDWFGKRRGWARERY